MHELAIAQALVQQVQAALEDRPVRQVLTINVALGQLSGVDAQCLEAAFPLAAAGTLAEHARLAIEAVPAEVRCRACGRTTAPRFPFFQCEACQGSDIEIVSGRDLTLKSVEIDTGDAG